MTDNDRITREWFASFMKDTDFYPTTSRWDFYLYMKRMGVLDRHPTKADILAAHEGYLSEIR